MNILVTGCAGFIGMHLSQRLLELGHNVIGLDNLCYDATDSNRLKKDRLKQLDNERFTFIEMDITDDSRISNLFDCQYTFDAVYHLAGQGGVRHSVNNPENFTQTNLVGFSRIIEGCRRHKVKHLLFASSSSVYGETKDACTEDMNTDDPKSYYAATKKANEVVAASYSSLYDMRITGFRLFTVYGPWGRPDMATWKFTKALANDEPLTLYKGGNLFRDFTYVDDTVDCLVRFIQDKKPTNDNFQIYNIGAGAPIRVMTYVNALENIMQKCGTLNFEKAPDADVSYTHCDMTKFKNHYPGKVQHTSIESGLARFVNWFEEYHKK